MLTILDNAFFNLFCIFRFVIFQYQTHSNVAPEKNLRFLLI
jgi:hypothetical protein